MESLHQGERKMPEEEVSKSNESREPTAPKAQQLLGEKERNEKRRKQGEIKRIRERKREERRESRK